MTEAFDILGFGILAVDDLLYVQEYPPAESKSNVTARLRQCGGLTGTGLVAAARLGARCAYVGQLGDDPLSREAMDGLRQEGIDVSRVARHPDARPAYSTIVVDETHRTRTIFSEISPVVGASPDWPPVDMIRSSKTLLVDHHGVEGTLRATRIARQYGVRVVADFERDSGGPFRELLDLVDHLVVSGEFAKKTTGESDPGRAALALWNGRREAVVVTLGEQGSYYLGTDSMQPAAVPAFAVNVVDTTGCGDVFHGAYAAALARGIPLPERVRFASAAAALKAQARGGQAGCPTLSDVESLLSKQASILSAPSLPSKG